MEYGLEKNNWTPELIKKLINLKLFSKETLKLLEEET